MSNDQSENLDLGKDRRKFAFTSPQSASEPTFAVSGITLCRTAKNAIGHARHSPGPTRLSVDLT